MSRARRALLALGGYLAISAWLQYSSKMYSGADLREPPQDPGWLGVLPYDGLILIAIFAAVAAVATAYNIHRWYHYGCARNQNQLQSGGGDH